MSMHSQHGSLTDPKDQIDKPSAVGITNRTPESGAGFVKTKDAQIIVNDGTTNRIVIGQRSNGTYGIKVAQSGKDALTGADSDMVMNSDFNMFKIIGKGTGTVTVAGGEERTTTIAHGMGFAPACVAYVSTSFAPGSYYPCPTATINTGTLAFDNFAKVNTNTTNVVLYVGSFAPATDGTYTFRYYLMQETAS